MRKISLLIFIAICFSIKLFAQIIPQKLKVGENINEKLLVQGRAGNTLLRVYGKNKFKGKNFILYRASERGGFIDKEDSIFLIKKTLKFLENNAASKTPTDYNLYLYFFDQGYSRNIALMKNLQNKQVSTFECITDTTSNPHSFTRADKVILVDSNFKVIQMWPSVAAFANDKTIGKTQEIKKLNGKLIDAANNKPLYLVKVALVSNNSDTISMAQTNNKGLFELDLPLLKQDYKLSISNVNNNVLTIILTSKEGKEISKLNRGANGFEYKLIPADINRMSDVEEKEDISASFNNFKSSKNKNISIEENIIYASGKFELVKESEIILDKVVNILKNNPLIKLDVVSHTDAVGDDNENLSLSIKRSNSVINYLVGKGIDKNRLNPIGKGETDIRNRCVNNIDCSDEEHAYNRRTEFNFKKS